MADPTGGIPYISQCDLTAITDDIRQRRDTSVEFKAKYDSDASVHDVLGRYGLAEDVQTELLRNDGRHAAASSCVLTCIKTCWFTDCACTGCCITVNG